MRHALYGLAIWAAVQAHTSAAYADVAPDGLYECVGKASGDACDGGSCQAQTCSRLDYENWDHDADGGPPWVEYDCLLCRPTLGQGGTGGHGGRSGEGGGAAKAGDAGAGRSGADAGQSTAGSDADSGCGGCAATEKSLGARGAALSFALLMGLLLGRGRRRKAR
jgi:hypothetical protein